MQICNIYRLELNKAISTSRFTQAHKCLQNEILLTVSWHWASPIPNQCRTGEKATCVIPLPRRLLTDLHGKGTPWAWNQTTPAQPHAETQNLRSWLSLVCARMAALGQKWGPAPKPGRVSLSQSNRHLYWSLHQSAVLVPNPEPTGWQCRSKRITHYFITFTCRWAFWIQSEGLPLIQLNQMCMFTRCFDRQIIFPVRPRYDNDDNSNFWSQKALESFPAVTLRECQWV